MIRERENMDQVLSESGINKIAATKAKRCVAEIEKGCGKEHAPTVIAKLIEYLTLEWETYHVRR